MVTNSLTRLTGGGKKKREISRGSLQTSSDQILPNQQQNKILNLLTNPSFAYPPQASSKTTASSPIGLIVQTLNLAAYVALGSCEKSSVGSYKASRAGSGVTGCLRRLKADGAATFRLNPRRLHG